MVLYKSPTIKFHFSKKPNYTNFQKELGLVNAGNINEDMQYVVAKDNEYESGYLFYLVIKYIFIIYFLINFKIIFNETAYYLELFYIFTPYDADLHG